ncbi:MAG: hypothetical protein ACJ76J_14090 [Thermoanaerobaculia bacterium]
MGKSSFASHYGKARELDDGKLLSAGVAGAGTWGIGEAAIAYFIENRSIEEAKERFRRRKEQKEGE